MTIETHTTGTSDELAAISIGTRFDPKPGSPFQCRSGHEDPPTDDLGPALMRLALDDAVDGYDNLPDYLYVKHVVEEIRERLSASGALSWEDRDALESAVYILAEIGAEHVARKWIAQRGSWPVRLPAAARDDD